MERFAKDSKSQIPQIFDRTLLIDGAVFSEAEQTVGRTVLIDVKQCIEVEQIVGSSKFGEIAEETRDIPNTSDGGIGYQES